MEAGQPLFQLGETADALYFIEVGQVTVVLEAEPGKCRALQTLGAGHPVGEMDFFLQLPHQTSALVNCPSTLYRLSISAFERLKQTHPQTALPFQQTMLQLLSRRLVDTYREIIDLT